MGHDRPGASGRAGTAAPAGDGTDYADDCGGPAEAQGLYPVKAVWHIKKAEASLRFFMSGDRPAAGYFRPGMPILDRNTVGRRVYGTIRRALFRRMVFQASMGGETLALIPGFSAPKTGARGAFLQVIGRDGSWFIPYPMEAFGQRTDPPAVRVGDSLFTPEGRASMWRRPASPCTGPSGTGSSPLPGRYHGGRSALPRGWNAAIAC